jgi:hypothetical protein
MPLCTTCGQSTGRDVEGCKACGGDVAAIGAYSRAARVLDSAGSRDAARSRLRYAAWAEFRATDPLSRRGPDRSQFQFQQPAGTDAFDHWPPMRTPVDRDRQLRNDRTLSAQLPYRRSSAAGPARSLQSPTPLLWPDPALSRAQTLSLDLALSPEPRPTWASPARQLPGTDGTRQRERPNHHDGGSATHRPGRSGGSHHRRTGVLAATRAVLFIAGVVAIVLAVHYGAPSQAAADRSPTTDPRPASATSASRPPVVDNLVTVEPGAATAPHEAAVVALLNRYFSAINKHAYRAYEKLFSLALRSGLSARTFDLGYGSSSDSAELVRTITVTGAGQVEAIVTFTSHQQPADSPTQSSCTAWRMSLYLIRHGPVYLLAAPPDGYQPSYRGCS